MEESVQEKNKRLMQKVVESNKKFEESLKVKPTKIGKIWFWLTCLRPLTKIEAAHIAQSIVQNRQLLNRMTVQMNSLTLKITEIIGFLQGKNSATTKDVNNEVGKQFNKKNEKQNKDDSMYQ